MQLNVRSMLAHQNDMRQLLHDMSNKNSRVDILLLSETFLTAKTEKLVNIPGYNLATNNRKHHKGGGVAILIRNGITFKKRLDLSCMIDKELESVYVDITARIGKLFRIGSLY